MKLGLFSVNPKNYQGGLLKTGQTTSYVSGDDGTNQKGISKSYTVLDAGQYSGTVSITINSKTDTHSNNCVLDNNTGLMWSRYASASVGPASDGKIPWTNTGSGTTSEGIYAYLSQANAMLLAGHSDWRLPNSYELLSLLDFEAPTGAPDGTAFPSYPTAAQTWSSNTTPNNTANALAVAFASSQLLTLAKTTNLFCLLVRSGNP